MGTDCFAKPISNNVHQNSFNILHNNNYFFLNLNITEYLSLVAAKRAVQVMLKLRPEEYVDFH
jgi:hypothetical protein